MENRENKHVVFGVVILITALISLVGNWVGTKVSPIEALPGMLVLVGIAAVGYIISEVLPFKSPAVLCIVTLGAVVTFPSFPGAAVITEYVSKVNFLALATPILAYAGIYTGENLDNLKKSGWKIIVLTFGIMVGTYLGSALIAQLILSLMGQI